MRFLLLRRGAVIATIVTGAALFATALQGVARVDTTLELAAARSTPERTLVLETGTPRGWECDRGRDAVAPV